MTTPLFYLNIRARGCRAEARLNDAPIFEWGLDYPTRAYPTVSEWVIDGENVLSVVVEEAEEGAAVHVALCEADLHNQPEPDDDVELLVIDWPPAPIPVEQGEEPEEPEEPPLMPPELRVSGPVTTPWGRWSWQYSPPFEPTVQTTVDVLTYARDVHALLVGGRVDALMAQSRIKFDELAAAYAMPVTDLQQRLELGLAELRRRPGWQLAPFDDQDVEVRLHCDGRLVEPTTLAGEPIIRQARPIDGESWSLPLFIARTNWEYTAGQLTIVR